MTLAARTSLFLEPLHRLPRFVRRGLLVSEGALQIHLGQEIVRVKFQEPRKQNLGLSKIACTEFLQSLLVRLEPLQEVWIDLFVSCANESKNIHRFGFAFHLYASNRAKVNIVSHQLGGCRADQNIEAINSSKALDARREIRRVANDRGIHALMRTDIANDDFTVIDANTHAKSHATLFAPFLIKLP